MRYIVFLFCAFSATISLRAQTVWESCEGPNSSFVGRIAHTSNNYIYIMNYDREDTSYVHTLYRSVDDGATWDEMRVFRKGAAHTIFSDDNDILYIACYDTLLLSSDYGETWTGKSVGTEPCWEFHIGPSGNFYAAGADKISVSRDRGDTWEKMTPPYNTDWIESIAEDENGDLYVCNGDRVLQRTNNLGFSWYEVHTSEWSECYSVFRGAGGIYVDANYGFFRTTNKGATWQKLGSIDGPLRKQIAMNSKGRIVCEGTLLDEPAVFASIDSGKTWNTLPPFPVAGAGLYNIDIDDNSRVLAGTDAGLFILQPDSTWKRSFERRGKEDDVRRVISLAPDRLLVAHETGFSEYNPQLNSWSDPDIPARFNDYIFSVVEGKDKTTILGCSFHLVRTTDDGATWQQGSSLGNGTMGSLYTDREHNLYSAWLANISTDNGDTWESTELYTNSTVYQDSRHNWYYIDFFEVLNVSTDAGQSWIRKTMPHYYSHSLLTKLGDRLVLSRLDTLCYSFDTGDTWEKVYTPIADDIEDLIKLPNGTIYAALAYHEDERGVTRGMARSDDNGYTWVYDDDGLQRLFCRNLVLHDDGHLYAATNNGLFRTATPVGVDRLEGTMPGSLMLNNAYPNPVTAGQHVSLQYTTRATASVSLKLYNTLGVVVYSATHDRSPGEHTLSIPTRGLVPGVYQCVLQNGNERTAQRLVVR